MPPRNRAAGGRFAAAGNEADSDLPIPGIPLLGLSREAETLESPLDRRSEAYKHAAAQSAAVHPVARGRPETILTIPNVLTFLRLLMVPILMILWEWPWRFSPITCAVVFIAAALTDWLDGYLARRLKICSVFGAFLDPVADKVMVSTTLILLTVSPPPPLTQTHMVLPVVLMICREVCMSALREWAAAAGGAAHKAVKVNSLGKWKTALQMVAISVLLVGRQPILSYTPLLPPAWLPAAEGLLVRVVWGAYAALWGGASLAIWSLAIYFANVWTHFIHPVAPHK